MFCNVENIAENEDKFIGRTSAEVISDNPLMPTCRRYLLDKMLERQKGKLRGEIIDIGGKKINKRGSFRPPTDGSCNWWYINISRDASPDILGDAESIPLQDDSIDGFLLCEVLEHTSKPQNILSEAYRILKPGGSGLITMPFLFGIHADPFDYQRWTNTKLEITLRSIGFSEIELMPMGGTLYVIHDLIYTTLVTAIQNKGFWDRIICKMALKSLNFVHPLIGRIGENAPISSQRITTGWFVAVKK